MLSDVLISTSNRFQMLFPLCLPDFRSYVVELDLGIIVLVGALMLYGISFTSNNS